MILYNALFILIVMLLIMRVYAFEEEPMLDWGWEDWKNVIGISILWPVGMIFLMWYIMFYKEFFIKEIDWKRLRLK